MSLILFEILKCSGFVDNTSIDSLLSLIFISISDTIDSFLFFSSFFPHSSLTTYFYCTCSFSSFYISFSNFSPPPSHSHLYLILIFLFSLLLLLPPNYSHPLSDFSPFFPPIDLSLFNEHASPLS